MVMPKKRADATALVFIIGATKELNEVFFFTKNNLSLNCPSFQTKIINDKL